VDHWASLSSLFKAKELDRSILDPAIAQALMDFAPADGYPQVSAVILDAGTIWRAICRHVFDMAESDPDLVSLLLWAASEKGPRRYKQTGEAFCGSLRKRLVHNLGDAAESILPFVESNAGAGWCDGSAGLPRRPDLLPRVPASRFARCPLSIGLVNPYVVGRMWRIS
jgi:hypothetical protein